MSRKFSPFSQFFHFLSSVFPHHLIGFTSLFSYLEINRVERSSDQVIKPVNLEALAKWVGKIPQDVVRDMADVAPMLSVLGYDPYANPPNYGNPDSFVRENTNKVSL